MIKYIFTAFLMAVAATASLRAQAPDAEKMKRQIEAMKGDPQKLMHFRDSLMNAVMHQEAKKLPNGDQLLIKHHYDTTYAKVHFTYMRTGNHETVNFSGGSDMAPVLYEANGHTIVLAFMGQKPDRELTSTLDKGAKGLRTSEQYMDDADKKQNHTDMASMMSFASMEVANNKLRAGASYNGGTSHGTTLISAALRFDYDPVENYSAAAVSGSLHRITDMVNANVEGNAIHDTIGIGMSVTTDMSKAKIAGAPAAKHDPDAPLLQVSKTKTGFIAICTAKSKNGNTSTLRMVIGEDEQQYEATIRPYKSSFYERWIPKGPKTDGTNDNKGDDSLRFYVLVTNKKDTNDTYPGTFTVKWRLEDITHYPGFCSNYPMYSKSPDTKPDLRFSDSMKRDTAYYIPADVKDTTAESKKDMGGLAVARVECMDYGGWGKLAADIVLEDGTELTAHPYYEKNTPYITIPYDKKENKIADAWEKMNGIAGKNYKLDWDEETKEPDNGNNGDDIALIDEYRGFVIDIGGKDGYKRLDPQTKEVFVLTTSCAANGYPELVKAASALYTKASGIQTYNIGLTPYTFRYTAKTADHKSLYDSWVNYNSPIKSHHTYGIPIYFNQDTSYPGEGNTKCLDGVAEGTGGYPPCDVDYANVFINRIHKSVLLPLSNCFAPHDMKPNAFKPHIRHAQEEFHMDIDSTHLSTIIEKNIDPLTNRYCIFAAAHEIGHATNVHHHHLEIPHGDGAYEGVPTCLAHYWNDGSPVDNATRDKCVNWFDVVVAFLSTNWDPATGIMPDGKPVRYCTSDDNCMKQLKLKK